MCLSLKFNRFQYDPAFSIPITDFNILLYSCCGRILKNQCNCFLTKEEISEMNQQQPSMFGLKDLLMTYAYERGAATFKDPEIEEMALACICR